MTERAARAAPPASRSWLRWGLALAIFGLGVAALAGAFGEPDGGSEAKRSEATSPTRTEPHTPRRRPRRGVQLTGHVHDAGGTPIKGATVFVLPKKNRGGVRDDLPHEVTDANGRWSLRAPRAFGCWIGVVARGYMHAWLDGDEVDPTVQMFHVLAAAPTLWVKLVDETGAPIPRKGVQLEPWPPSATWFLPGPGARQGEQWAVSDEDGDAFFKVGSKGPVILRPHVEGRHAGPHPTWLPQPEGDVTLRLERNRSLHVKLSARESSTPLQGLATADLHDPTDGRVVLSFTEIVGADGVLRIDRGVRPGVYDLHVHAEGHGRVLLPALRLQGGDADDPDVVSVSLPSAAEEGTLTIRFEQGAEGPSGAPPDTRRRAPLTYLLRDDPGWRNLRWQPGAPEAWEPEAGTLVLKLEPGRYHLLVADVVGGRAALQRDLGVAPGVDLEVAVQLARGLKAAAATLPLRNGRARSVGVTAAFGLELPVYGSARGGQLRVSNVRNLLARAAEGIAVQLGPYPAEAVTVTVANWDGTTHEATFDR